MIVIPFSNGVVAAFLFLIFEGIVFPFLFYSTSKLASLSLYRSARRGNHVVVDTMRFPLWSDGLIRRQACHVFLLAVRIALLAIPVYLETTLDSRDDPEIVSRIVTNAFVPQPTDDWYGYQTRSEEDIRTLRIASLNVFFACASVDEGGWVWAKVANVTYMESELVQIRCVRGTEQPIYRLTEETIKFAAEEVVHVTLRVSWTEGRLADFPSALIVKMFNDEEAPPSETAFRIRSLTALNDTGMECFVADSVKTRYSQSWSGKIETSWKGWCQKEQPKGFAFYVFQMDFDQLPMRNASLREVSDRRTWECSCKFRNRNATTVVAAFYRGSFEFKHKVVLGAKHMANYKPNWSGSLRASDMARSVLYSKASNVTVAMWSGRSLPRTEIGVRAIVIGVCEIVGVVLFTFLLSCGLRWKWRYIQEPNTISGLSSCWAKCEYDLWHQSKEGRKWVNLTLFRTGFESEGPLRFTPCEIKTREEKFESVTAYV